jgi:hypothetical protein
MIKHGHMTRNNHTRLYYAWDAMIWRFLSLNSKS